MFKQIVVFLVLGGLSPGAQADTWQDAVKQSIDATQAAEMPLLPDGSAWLGDLTPDPAFATNGMKAFWPDPQSGMTNIEYALRTFPYTVCSTGTILICSHGGYYVVSKQKASSGSWRAAITRHLANGNLDVTFGTNGWMFGIEQDDIVDAAMGNGKMYVLGNIYASVGTPITRVACFDLATGANCFSGFGGVTAWGVTQAGPRTAAHGQRLIHDSRYGLHVAAKLISTTRGMEVGIARLDEATGALISEFRDGGYNIGLPTWAHATAAEVTINDMAVAPSGSNGGERLYIAGSIKRTTVDHDGFVLGLNPTTGTTSSGWGWNAYYYESDNPDAYLKDSISAISVLRNGKLAMAGWSEADQVHGSGRHLILSRANVDGSLDANFCRGTGTCTPKPAQLDHDDVPFAIAERDGNRDLVVALREYQEIPTDNHLVQTVWQFSASGNQARTVVRLDYPSSPSEEHWSSPASLWIGRSGIFGLSGREIIAVAGTRKWNATDYDATISQLIANDSIFADQFGGASND